MKFQNEYVFKVMVNIINSIRKQVLSGDIRSVKAKKNILLSFFNKIIAIVISFALVPITVNYLDQEQYGIWLTITSIVSWISFFDIGLGHGFKNKIAEAKANNDIMLCKKYVSTAYFIFIILFGTLLIIFECVNPFINWAAILNVSPNYSQVLSSVVSIVLIGTCLQFVAAVFPLLLSADQRPALSSMITTVGQAFSLIIIFILTLYPIHNMTYIAVALSWTPLIITCIISCWFFKHQYNDYMPSLKMIDTSLIRNILNLGVKFFVIQFSMIAIFQVVNIILSRVLGPSSVTEYNISYKYFSATLMLFNIILSPYWIAFTDAYTKTDYKWMKNTFRKLTKVWFALFCLSLLALIVSPIAFDIWLNGMIKIPFVTSLCMFIYINILAYSTMNMILINGIGKVFLQSLIYIVCAVFSIPLSVSLCKQFGIPGILIVLSSVYMVQAIFARVQLIKLINNKAIGIWNK